MTGAPTEISYLENPESIGSIEGPALQTALQEIRNAAAKYTFLTVPDTFQPESMWQSLLDQLEDDQKNELLHIIRATRIAAYLTSLVIGKELEIEDKRDSTDVVSALDKANNDIIYHYLNKNHIPTATIFEENNPTHAGLEEHDRYITCDGIDGSKAASRATTHNRLPFAAIMNAAGPVRDTQAQPADIAVVDVTAYNTTIIAVKGHGVWINGIKQTFTPPESQENKKPTIISINPYGTNKKRSSFMKLLRTKLEAAGVQLIFTDASSLDPLRFINRNLAKIVQNVEDPTAIAQTINLHIHEGNSQDPKQGPWDYHPIQLIMHEAGFTFQSLTDPTNPVTGNTPIVSGPPAETEWLMDFIKNDNELQQAAQKLTSVPMAA